MSRRPLVRAAGAVVWRREPGSSWSDGRLEVLVIHRPKYDDWSLPKGKLDPGETLPTCAVREVAEETGLTVRLGVRLADTTYPVRGEEATKHVTYWAARPLAGDPSDYEANREVDGVRWAPIDEVRTLLTYPRDREVLEAFEATVARGAHRARTLLLVRHAEARPRKRWRGDDLERPLSRAGRRWAQQLPDEIAAWAPRRAISSPAFRCLSTLTPWSRRASVDVVIDPRLAESSRRGGAPTKQTAGELVADLTDRGRTVVCTHRPVLPLLYQALGLPHIGTVAPGSVVVVHHRHGRLLGHEVHAAP